MKTSARGYSLTASWVLLCRGTAISSLPKNSFWKPPATPGCTTQATEGAERPVHPQHVSRLGAMQLLFVGLVSDLCEEALRSGPLSGASHLGRSGSTAVLCSLRWVDQSLCTLLQCCWDMALRPQAAHHRDSQSPACAVPAQASCNTACIGLDPSCYMTHRVLSLQQMSVQILHTISPVVEDGLSVLAEYLAHHHTA